MQINVRKMETSDIKAVQDIARESWNSTYRDIIPLETQEAFLKFAYSNEMMKKRLDSTYMYIAEISGKIMGFANFSPLEDGRVELSAIYLLPKYLRNGVGTALLNYGIKRLEGMNELIVEVEKENKIGMNFYKAKGFNLVSEYEDNFNGTVLTTVKMSLKLVK